MSNAFKFSKAHGSPSKINKSLHFVPVLSNRVSLCNDNFCPSAFSVNIIVILGNFHLNLSVELFYVIQDHNRDQYTVVVMFCGYQSVLIRQ